MRSSACSAFFDTFCLPQSSGTTPQDPWGFQYIPHKHVTSILQSDPRNDMVTTQASMSSVEDRREELQSIPSTSFHHFPQSQPVVPSSAYPWHNNNFDLDNLFFDASTFSANSVQQNAVPSINEDINSLLANWVVPGQSLPSTSGDHSNQGATGPITTLEAQNDDFMRWLSGDIGASMGQPLTFSTPETVPNYAANYDQNKSLIGSGSDGTFQFSMSSERGGQHGQENGRTTPAHPSLQHGIRTRPPSPALPQQSDQNMQWPMAWEPNRMEHDAGLSTNVIEFAEGEGNLPIQVPCLTDRCFSLSSTWCSRRACRFAARCSRTGIA